MKLRIIIPGLLLILFLLIFIFVKSALTPFSISDDRTAIPGSNLSIRIIEGYSATRFQGVNHLIIEVNKTSMAPHFNFIHHDITGVSEQEIEAQYFVDAHSSPEKLVINGVTVFFIRYEDAAANLSYEVVTPAKAYIINGNNGYLISAVSTPSDAELASKMLYSILQTVEVNPQGN